VCQCPAGAGFKCKHIAALIIYVNSEEGPSKTDEPHQWGRPEKYGQLLCKKGKKISDIFPQKQLNNTVPIIYNIVHNNCITYIPILWPLAIMISFKTIQKYTFIAM